MNSLLSSLMRDTAGSFIGFDDVFKTMVDYQKKLTHSFPPYNIKKVGENKYTIELAVAGFGKQDIEVTLDKDTLVITGKSSNKNDAESYLYNGLAQRAFTRSFMINDSLEVKGASLVNGILKIALERVAEDKSVKKIEIDDEASTVSEFAATLPQLLTEEEMEQANGKLM